MTYSISSGFLPSSFRELGTKLANQLGYTLEPSERQSTHTEQTLRLIASKQKIDWSLFERLSATELLPLGGVGWSMRSLLALQVPDINEAENSYFKAQENGDKASWAAYALGRYYMHQHEYLEAVNWFALAEGDLADSIHVHSLSLRALSECKLDHFENGFELAMQCIELTPLRFEAYKMAIVAAVQLDRRKTVSLLKCKLKELENKKGL